MKEYFIEKQVFLKLRQNGFVVMKIINEATYNRRHFAVMRGAPDLVAISPDGIVLWLEIKQPKGRLTQIQKIAHETLKNYKQKVYIIRDLKDLENIMANL